MVPCPRCGEENPDRAQFCLACGERLLPAAAAGEIRKTVTIIFSDVIGSTHLGERLDPESLRRVMSRYFAEMRAVLERHGGTVEKFIGDAVMAVFGIPTLHEDDALRTVRAAVEMIERLEALNRELEHNWGVSLAVRTGINSGEVVAGGDDLVTGDAVNVAARLEQVAPPGQILLGEATVQLVRHAVRVERLDPLSLKGKKDRFRAFRLIDVVPDAPTIVRRLDSPMVDRDVELALLQRSFLSCIDDRGCRLFTIAGSAGVGKSRLVREFVSWVGGRASRLHGRCLPYGEGITYRPIAQVVKQAAEIDDGDSAQVVTRRLAAVLEGQNDVEIIVERVAALLGIGKASVPNFAETFWAVRRTLEALAHQHPVVVVLEDIHWAESSLLDLIEYIADHTRGAPLLLLCTARTELFDNRPVWDRSRPNAASAVLEPLTSEESRKLIENFLGHSKLQNDTGDRISEAAEGNPLFIEEILSMLIEEGVITRLEDRWAPTADMSQIVIPPTIQTLLAARLDQLSQEERQVIQPASVVGRLFYWSAVSALTPPHLKSSVGNHLTSLVQKGLIYPEESDLAREDAFRFRHTLIKEAAYQSTPKQLRAELHERFAEWLGGVARERIGEYDEVVGHHLERAVTYRAELGPQDEHARAMASRAASLFASAGRRAIARGDAASAAKQLQRAASLLAPSDPTRPEVLRDLGVALAQNGRFDRADVILVDAGAAAAAARNRRIEADVVVQRAFVRLETDPGTTVEEVRREAEPAIKVLEDIGDDRGLAKAWQLVATEHWVQCHAAPAEAAWHRALEHAQRADDPFTVSESFGGLAAAAFWGSTPVEQGIQRCEDIDSRAHGDRQTKAVTTAVRSRFEALQGGFERARELASEAAAIVTELGFDIQLSMLAATSADIEMLAGNASAAEREMQRGYEAVERMGETGQLPLMAALRARPLYAQGRYDDAERYVRISEELGGKDDVATAMLRRGTKAKILARRGQAETAESVAREAVSLAQQTDFINDHADVLMDFVEVLAIAGRGRHALSMAQRALSLYEQKGNLISGGKARRMLEELRSAGS